MNDEIWKPVVGLETFYEVSNLARIRSIGGLKIRRNGRRYCRDGQLMAQSKAVHGYMIIRLRKMGESISGYVHRFVAQAFIPNPLGLPQVNHKDGTRDNNRPENLEWVTNSQNIKHGYTFARRKRISFPGELSANAKLTNESVGQIRSEYRFGDMTYGSCGLARRFGVDPALILRVVKRQVWRHI